MAEDRFSTGTLELEEAETKVDRPPLFTVVFFNMTSHQWSLSYM